MFSLEFFLKVSGQMESSAVQIVKPLEADLRFVICDCLGQSFI